MLSIRYPLFKDFIVPVKPDSVIILKYIGYNRGMNISFFTW